MTAIRNLRPWAPAVICALAGAALFQFWGNATRGYIATNSLFYWWTFQWVNPASETEHAWLVLGLSGFLLCRNLRREKSNGLPTPRVAAATLLGALLVHTLGFVAQQPRISIVGLLAYVWGIFLLAGGKRWGRTSAFPLAFMVFAVPLNALDTVGFWLQMWVVHSGARIAHLLGIAVIQNGTQLFAPNGRYKYDVVAACSGVRSLMALSALSLFAGYLWFKPIWLRALIFFASFPLVYLANVVRISAIVIAAQWGGQRWGDRVHDVMGFGIFVIVVGGVVGVAELIASRRPEWTAPEGLPPVPGPSLANLSSRGGWTAVVVAVLAVADAGFLSYRASRPPEERPGVLLGHDGANPTELPTFLSSDWMGQRVDPEPIERAILPPDTGFSRKLYVNLANPAEHVLLSIVLSGRDRTSIHRPELCLVGQGWSIDRTSSHHFSYPGIPSAAFVGTVLFVHRDAASLSGLTQVPEVVVYWFVGDNRVVASQSARMWYDAWSRVAHGRAPRWAYVFLQTGAVDGEAAALARVQAILSAALPQFQPPVGS